MSKWKYEGRYCGDCGNYSRITHKCRKGYKVSFEGGCKNCGTARPFRWLFNNEECRDFFTSPNLVSY